ncbi:MAG: U32 family peptidase [Spirochaetaceae bacterium]|nr:U32 family peptidase [Spirochaetaceae bacterium]
MKRVELLAPAGSPEALSAAFGEGADAVYLGLRSFNARMRSANFAFNQLEAALQAAHDQGRKIFVTVNTVFEDWEADRLYQLLQYLSRVKPDGIIVQDLGVAKMARENFPGLALHASTQMNVASARGCNFLSRLGFKRVVLARELSLDEIRQVSQNTSMELETFVHGALCVSASGLCLFSSYLGGKSANRGACTQACRRLYDSETGKGYYFSPDDLQLIDYIPDLIEAGVDSFKIEGRMKSAEYVGTVVAAYRHLIDNWEIDREKATIKAKSLLQADFARSKTSFFIAAPFASPAAQAAPAVRAAATDPAPATQTAQAAQTAVPAEAAVQWQPDYIHPDQAGGTGIHLGKIRDVRSLDGEPWALMASYDGLAEGDSIRIHRHDDSGRITSKIKGIRFQPNGMLVKFDGDWRQNDEVYLLQTASMAKRYKPALPRNLDRFRAFPSHDNAPRIRFPAELKSPGELRGAAEQRPPAALPDGFYALVGKTADLHAVLAVKPVKAMIVFDRLNAESLRKNEQTIPYKRDRLILWLDPYYPEADSDWLEKEVAYWVSRGIRTVVVNNLGHFSFLRGMQAEMIAGPWLYAFNTWAASFLFEQGVRYLIPPMEISKQDLMGIAKTIPPSALMPVVFSYPPLFRIRADLSSQYDSKRFVDRDGSAYTLRGRRDYSLVVPEAPFSIIDRTPFLRKERMTKFILDLSNADSTKGLFRNIAKAADEARVLDGTSRFNWKDGFYSDEAQSHQ